MSLAEAVLEVANQMEAEMKVAGKEGDCAIGPVAARAFVRQLRSAVKAAEGCVPAAEPFGASLLPGAVARNKILEVEQRRVARLQEEIREQEVRAEHGPGMVEVVGGPAAGIGEVPQLVEFPSSAPVGARTLIAGAVYELSPDRKLVYNEEQTKKLRPS